MFNGKIIRFLREEKGLTQEELARMAGVERDQLSRYETGRRKPSVERAIRLAKALQVSVEIFFGNDVSIVTRASDPNPAA